MILSVSRRTDIPAYYSDWFYNLARELAKMAHKNFTAYDSNSPILCGKITEEDKVSERAMKSWKVKQMSLFEN